VSTTTQQPAPGSQTISLATTVVTSWKAPIAFALLTLAALALALFVPPEGDTTFRLSSPTDAIQLPEITVPAMPTLWLVIVLLAVVTAYSVWLVASKRRVPLWTIVVFAVLFMFGFLTWAAAGASLPMIGLLFGSLSLAVPLIYGSMAGVLGERAGVLELHAAVDGNLHRARPQHRP